VTEYQLEPRRERQPLRGSGIDLDGLQVDRQTAERFVVRKVARDELEGLPQDCEPASILFSGAGGALPCCRRLKEPPMPKMKAYASFDLYLADQSPRNRTVLRALRSFMRKAAPKLEEGVKWGNGCWLDGRVPVAYAYSDVDHVQFGFFRGASLEDPKKLLQGKGQYVRHVKVRKVGDIDSKAFGALVRQAIALGST
jgi:hypothetical protein